MIELHQGDCMEVMAEMEENSVDAVITDPPYGIKIGQKGQIGGRGFSKPTQYKPVEWDDIGLTMKQFILCGF